MRYLVTKPYASRASINTASATLMLSEWTVRLLWPGSRTRKNSPKPRLTTMPSMTRMRSKFSIVCEIADRAPLRETKALA